MNKFTLIPSNNFIWNQEEFIQFLIENQQQKIFLSTNMEGVCLQTSGVYRLLEQFDYKDVIIQTNNLLEQHPQYQIKLGIPFYFFKVAHSNYIDLHYWNQHKVFGCFYNRPLWHRVGLAAVLQHDYDCALINIRAPFDTVDQRKLTEINQLFSYSPDSFSKFAKVFKSWPLQLEDHDTYIVTDTTTGYTDRLARFYPNILIDVVAETWTAGKTFYPTEKTVRPMLLKKPFILMGSKDYLCYLRQLGFKTFNDFWSEDYDGYEELERFARILQLIDELSKKSITELEKMYWDMQDVLDHNYNLLLNQNYATSITYVE
jgi:hypothetical protein